MFVHMLHRKMNTSKWIFPAGLENDNIILRDMMFWRDHNDVIKWKHFPHYWPFVWGIHRLLVNSSQKGQWRGALIFSLICAWICAWVNNHEAGELRLHRAHYDVIVMWFGPNQALNGNGGEDQGNLSTIPTDIFPYLHGILVSVSK